MSRIRTFLRRVSTRPQPPPDVVRLERLEQMDREVRGQVAVAMSRAATVLDPGSANRAQAIIRASGHRPAPGR